MTIVVIDYEFAVFQVLEAIISFGHVISGNDSVSPATSLLFNLLSLDRPALFHLDPSSIVGFQEIDIFFWIVDLVVTVIITRQGRFAEMNADNPLVRRFQMVPDDSKSGNDWEAAARERRVRIF